MLSWSKASLAAYFESGVNSHATASRPSEPGQGRLYAVSDVHTDKLENMAWWRRLEECGAHRADSLILAGDVSHRPDVLLETLQIAARAFRTVHFVPGNHDLWVRGGGGGGGGTSIDRLLEIEATCARLGVCTAPALAAGAIVVPILSWHHPSWDTEPDISGWRGIPPVERCLMDYHMTRWPPGVRQEDGSAAAAVDELNDRPRAGGGGGGGDGGGGGGGGDGGGGLLGAVEELRRLHPSAPVVTASHFVPRVELSLEKRYLFLPTLAKAIGSEPLRARVEALRPDMHVFGHTHFGWDATLDGVRYVQAALSYPEERRGRLGTIATGDHFPHGGGDEPAPLLVWDGAAREFAPRYRAGWSAFYDANPRRPALTHLLAPYVASRYQAEPGVGEVGWGPGVTQPAWQFGPPSTHSTERAARAEREG